MNTGVERSEKKFILLGRAEVMKTRGRFSRKREPTSI